MAIKMLKKIFLIILVTTLSACTSMNAANKEEAAKKSKIAGINVQLGMAYLGKGDNQRAKQKLLYALEKDPQLPEAWYSMAYFLESTGNRKEAGQYYLKALALAPHRGDVQNNYGTYLCRSGDYSGAIQHFMEATKDTQYLDLASAYENAGLCSMKIPDKVQAKRYFTQALEQDPTRMLAMNELSRLKNV